MEDSLVAHGSDAPECTALGFGDLALRVCGTEHDGRIVRLHARKCTIGSGESCTLRLRARGIERVHCLIVRGARGAAVRRWSQRTRLNGGAFLDAPLIPGDRLGIGPLELEVVETPVASASAAPATDLPGAEGIEEISARLAALEALLDEQTQLSDEERRRRETMQAEAESLVSDKLQIERRLQRAEDETRLALEKADYWEEVAASRTPGDSTDERDSLKRRIEELEAELRKARNAIETASGADRFVTEPLAPEGAGLERDAWEAELSDLRRELEETRRSLGAERDDLQAQLAASQEAATVRVSPEQFRAERREWEQSIAELKGELEQSRRTREAECARYENELSELRRALAEQPVSLAVGQSPADNSADLEAERQALRRQREHQERDLAEAREQLARFKAKLEERSQALDLRESELHERKKAGASSPPQVETTHEAESAALEEERETLRRQRQHQERELEEAREQLARFKAKLEERSQALDLRESELNEKEQALASRQTASIPAGGNPPPEPAAELDEAPEPESFGTLVLPRREAVEASQAPPQPESAAEVLARMGYSPAWPQEEEQMAAEPVVPAPPVVPFLPSAAADRPSQPTSDEEESIEDYMNRLLQRVRGDEAGSSYRVTTTTRTAPPPNRTAPPPSRTTPAAQLRAAPPPQDAAVTQTAARLPSGGGEQAATINPEEFLPRSQAPERSEHLAAMRDLANTSARTAIGRHTRARWLATCFTRTVLGLGALVACIFLIIFSTNSPVLAFSGAAFAAIGSAYWLIRALRDARQFTQSRGTNYESAAASPSRQTSKRA
jgi:hypothetical protein